MVTINTAQRYTFSIEGLNSGSNFLTSSKDNNSLILQLGSPSGENDEKWYFSNSGDAFYFRIHNGAKGDDWAIETTGSTDSDDDGDSVFFSGLNNTKGQFWRIYPWETDGRWRITSLLGPDGLFLGINEDSRIAYLRDNPREANQQWVVNSVSSESLVSTTSTVKPSSTSTPASTSAPSTITACASASSSSSSSSCTIGPSQSNSSKLSEGAIAGIVVGVVAGLALIIWLIFYLLKKKKPAETAGEQEHLGGEYEPQQTPEYEAPPPVAEIAPDRTIYNQTHQSQNPIIPLNN